ncbi:MAG: cold shock domain-containing protein [bacterium]|nr:cold shock domain-containing protein [bacterium]
MAQKRINGKVKWFNNGRCYGRVTGEDGQDYLIHFSKIEENGTGFRSLTVGEMIEFEPAHNPDRPLLPDALKVQRLEYPNPVKRQGTANPRFKSIPRALTLLVDSDGNISAPQFGESHPWDYHNDGNVHAFYVDRPGMIDRIKGLILEVELPDVLVSTPGVCVMGTDFNGGSTHRRFHSDFQGGHFVLVTKLIGENRISVEAKKISLRFQGPQHVKDERDRGVWLIVESPFEQELLIPEYSDERDLKEKIRIQIPDPDNSEPRKPGATFRKFSKAIALAIEELLPSSKPAQSATA